MNARPKKIFNFQKSQNVFEFFLKKCCIWFDKSPYKNRKSHSLLQFLAEYVALKYIAAFSVSESCV